MKVLITTDLYKPLINGVVTSVLNLKDGLEKQGHEVRVLTLSQGRHSEEKDGVYYIGSVNTSWVYPGTRLKLKVPRHFLREIVAWHPDVIHSQCEFSTYGCAKKIARACSSPLVHTYHTVYENYTHYFCPSKTVGKHLVSGFSRHVLNKAAVVIAPTGKVGNLLKNYGVKRPVAVIPSGIDLERYSQTPSEEWIEKKRSEYGLDGNILKLIYVGRLAKEKNVDELLRMMATCKDMPVKLLIVGDGPVREELEKHCEELDITQTVIFTGMIDPDEVGKYYHIGDVFVNASTSETQGLTYVEAMAAGLPMLCKKDECLDGLVLDGINGWQFHDATEFRELLKTLTTDQSLRDTMSIRAAYEAQKFSTPHFVESVEELYANTMLKR